MGRPIIEVRNLSKVYKLGAIGTNSLKEEIGRLWTSIKGNGEARRNGEFWALRDVSFDVQPGEVVGIIGRNGAGKSTLLKILSRITQQTTGEVTLRGRMASLLEVGTGFHPDLTGRENIYLNGAILGMKKSEIARKFDEIVAFAEVEEFIDTPVKRYSSGMYVRLAFAVAAYLEPEILVIDEVLAVGDLAFQNKCIGKMGDVAKKGRTVIVVSHNMQVISSLCSQSIYLENGRVIAEGKVANVVAAYLRDLEFTENNQFISNKNRAVKSNYLQIKRLQFLNSKGEKTNTIHFKERFAVKLVFDVKQPITDIRFGVDIFTPEGTRISVTHHTDGGLEPLALDKGCYSITAQLQNLLVPGNYFVGVGAHDLKTTRGLDWIPQAAHFTVLGFSQEGIYQHDEYNAGFTYVPAIWTEVTNQVSN